MRWFYFIVASVDGENRLSLLPPWIKLPMRPADANDTNGDPLTPWYTTEDHHDEKHVHVYAGTLAEALLKARGRVGNLERSTVINQRADVSNRSQA